MILALCSYNINDILFIYRFQTIIQGTVVLNGCLKIKVCVGMGWSILAWDDIGIIFVVSVYINVWGRSILAWGGIGIIGLTNICWGVKVL